MKTLGKDSPLGMTKDAFGQTWHLPCDDERMTYAEIIQYSQDILSRPCEYHVEKMAA